MATEEFLAYEDIAHAESDLPKYFTNQSILDGIIEDLNDNECSEATVNGIHYYIELDENLFRRDA